MKKVIFTFLFLISLLGGQDMFSQVRKSVSKPVSTPTPEVKNIVPTPKRTLFPIPEETKCFSDKSLDINVNV